MSVPSPLKGVRIIALEHFVAGPYGSMLLADWGAEVIRIERPGVGEAMRNPVFTNQQGQLVPLVYMICNRNKKCITLNMKSEEGRKVFADLVKDADIVWENQAPDALGRMGFDFESLKKINPRIIYTSISGFGHDDLFPGPLADRPALDFIAQAMSGLMWGPTFGQHPMWLGLPITDTVTGIFAAMGVMGALRERDRTGEAQRVDISLYDVSAVLNEKNIAFHSITGRKPNGMSEMTNQLGVIQASDGFLVIGVVNNAAWPGFCELLGRPDMATDPRLANLKLRADHYESVVRPVLDAWCGQHTVDAAVQKILALGIAAGPVQTHDQVMACPQLNARDMFVKFDSEHGPITSVGNPIKFSAEKYPAEMPASLGAHTDEVLRDLLKLPEAEIRKMRESGVI